MMMRIRAALRWLAAPVLTLAAGALAAWVWMRRRLPRPDARRREVEAGTREVVDDARGGIEVVYVQHRASDSAADAGLAALAAREAVTIREAETVARADRLAPLDLRIDD